MLPPPPKWPFAITAPFPVPFPVSVEPVELYAPPYRTTTRTVTLQAAHAGLAAGTLNLWAPSPACCVDATRRLRVRQHAQHQVRPTSTRRAVSPRSRKYPAVTSTRHAAAAAAAAVAVAAAAAARVSRKVNQPPAASSLDAVHGPRLVAG
eukprot:363925-Chlamydomonas_euryale.AAC.15